MRRIAAFAALIFGLTALVAVPAVITAAPASALVCPEGQVPDFAQISCVQNSGTGGGESAMMACWNGTSVPVTSACPVAPSGPTSPNVTCSDGTSHPSGFVCPTTTAGSGAGSGTYTNPVTALCSDKITLVSQGCPPTSGSGSTGSGIGALTIKCADGSYRNTAIECPGGTTSTGGASTGGASSCAPNTAWNGTYCAPTTGAAAEAAKAGGIGCPALTMWNGKECAATMGGSTSGSGSTGNTNPLTALCPDKITLVSKGCPITSGSGMSGGGSSALTIPCADGSYRNTAIECPGGATVGSGGTGSSSNTFGSSGSQSTVQPGADPCLLSPDRAKCEAGKLAAISLCPSGSFFDQGIQGCKSVTAQSATIACADGTFKVTALECSTFGGAVGSAIAASTGSTCANGYAPNSTGFCVPIATLAGNSSASNCGPATSWNGTWCAPTTGASAGAAVPACGALTAWDGTKCAPTILVATAAGASLGGSCLDGYVASSAGICMPKGYDNGANMPASKNTGPISTAIDPCRVTPVPPSCIASGAVKVSESTVVQAQTARYGPPAPPPGQQSSAGGGGTTSSQFAAPPAKNGKAPAPVLIFNVLGSDNKALTDSNGKELTTRPAVKSGNTVFVDKSGSPVITAPTLDPSGRPVTGPDGAVLYTRLMTFAGQEAVTDSSGRAVTATPLLNGAGKALQASNGRVVYAPPVLDAKGNILLNSYGSPVLAQPLSDATGGIAVGPTGEPVVVQPMVAEGGKAILKNGQLIYVGGAGSQALTAKNESIQTAFGQTITFCNSGALADEGGNAVLGPDGRAVILSASGVPISANGAVLLDQKGKPIRVTANGGVTDSSGRPILGADSKQIKLGASEVATVLKSGKNVIKSSDGKTVTVGLNGQLVDTAGNPVLTAGNKPIFIDPKTKTFKDPSGKAITVSKTGVIAAKSTPLAYQTGALDAA